MNRSVLMTALDTHDPYDQFAWCQEWRFAICDYLLWEHSQTVPGFRTAMSGPDDESFAYQELLYQQPETEALRYALHILDRFREQLRIAGKDY